jgi:hypothetical protein
MNERRLPRRNQQQWNDRLGEAEVNVRFSRAAPGSSQSAFTIPAGDDLTRGVCFGASTLID